MSSSRRLHASSTSSAGSLMQDVPGSFPVQPAQQIVEEEPVYQSLSQAVFARRDEYVRPGHVRIKIGSWNVAALKGTEKDLAAWFVDGRGIEEALNGLKVDHQEHVHRAVVPASSGTSHREDAASQEARFDVKHPSAPHGDDGAVAGNEHIGLYVLALQEVVDVNAISEAFRTDPATSKRWKDTLENALPKSYMLIAEQQLVGLLLLIYASPDIGKEVHAISTTSVGTGIGGYMGNKGAVTARIVLGETTRLVFINSHLAAGSDKQALDRRNWDASQIVQRTRFAPLHDVMDLQQISGEQIGDEDFAFWTGDLNYRLEGIPAEDVRRLFMLHTRNMYDLSTKAAAKVEHEISDATKTIEKHSRKRGSIASSASSVSEATTAPTSLDGSTTENTILDDIAAHEDPTSLQTTIDSLLPHDELRQQMKARKAFHDGWREGPIRFLPTYKYDVGSVGVFDTSDKKRGPSYCDRILFRTRKDRLAYEALMKEEADTKKKDEEMRARGADEAGTDEEILYDYDPDTDGANDDYDEYDEQIEAADGVVLTKGGFEDELTLESYVTHQRILSSDHKPMDAVFMLKYDKVVPELKTKVHAEVVREMDKSENESRPNVTVVVDKHRSIDEQSDADPAHFEGVWFSDLRWAQAKHRSLTIANTGQVPAAVAFIERPIGADQDAGIAPSWLNISVDDETLTSSSPSTRSFNLEPGDAINVQLEIRVLDIRMIRGLNEGSKTLEDILLLRVDGGRDHFIPVRAKWQDTSLGRGIEKLIRIPEGGIRKLQNQSLEANSQKSLEQKIESLSLDSPIKFSAPRELFRLTEAIEDHTTRVVAEWEMTSAQDDLDAPWQRYPGWPFDEDSWTERKTALWASILSNLCDALDTDRPLVDAFPERLPQSQRLYMLCNLLLIFLRNIPEGIIPEDQWAQIERHLNEVDKSKTKPGAEEEKTAIQEILVTSPPHNICFILLTTMLDRVTKELNTTKSQNSNAQSESAVSGKPSTLRRVTGRGRSTTSTEQTNAARTSLARIIALAAIHPTDDVPERIRAVLDKRKASLVEMFLARPE